MKRQHGFTLAELLVATMLLSIVMTAVYTLVYSVISSWRTVEENYDVYRDARNAFTIMQREFDSVIAGHLFEGEKDELTLFTVSEPFNMKLRSWKEGRRLLQVRYRVNKGDHTLVREEGLVTNALPMVLPEEGQIAKDRISVKNKKRFEIASNVRDFSLEYVWVPAPTERDRTKPPQPIEHIVVNKHDKRWRLGLPQAVRVTLTLVDPKDKKNEHEVESLIPIRTMTGRYDVEKLKSTLKDEL